MALQVHRTLIFPAQDKHAIELSAADSRSCEAFPQHFVMMLCFGYTSHSQVINFLVDDNKVFDIDRYHPRGRAESLLQPSHDTLSQAGGQKLKFLPRSI